MNKIKWNKKSLSLLLAGTIALTSSTYVGVKQAQYTQIINSSDFELIEANDELIGLIKKLNKSKITLTSVGNSIATGYSMKDEIKPLLIRNSELFDLLGLNGIDFETYSFARMQDNCDEHTYNYLINGTRQSKINEMVQYDFRGEGTGVKANTITDEEIQLYYPLVPKKDRSLEEIVESFDIENMNIVVYNGGTGSFLDNVTRGSEDLLNCFERDAVAVESFCKYVFLKQPNTQIYLCGVPNFLNLGITSPINREYKEIADLYPNVTYVESAPAKVFYQTANGLEVDIHFDKDEYLCHNKNIIRAICDNYISNSVCIDLHTALRYLNEKIQFLDRNMKGNPELLEQIIYQVLDGYRESGIPETQINAGIDKFSSLYRQRCGYDYYYTSKDLTLLLLEQYKKMMLKNMHF